MATRKTYAEKLKHPKWQEKRLRCLERAGFACENCGDNESTLHVHHGWYKPGAEPWDVPDDWLHALCETCHLHATERMTIAKGLIGSFPTYEIDRLIGFLFAGKCARFGRAIGGVATTGGAGGIAAYASISETWLERFLDSKDWKPRCTIDELIELESFHKSNKSGG